MTNAWIALRKWVGSVTTVANDRGQSLIEFVILIPIFIGLVIILVRSNTTIQMSIVNQKYARAQTLAINYNSAYYPRRSVVNESLAPDRLTRMDIGVAENAYNEDTPGNVVPEASQFVVSRPGQALIGDQAGDPNQAMGRSKVRVRTNVALCGSPQRYSRKENTGSVPEFEFCRGHE